MGPQDRLPAGLLDDTGLALADDVYGMIEEDELKEVTADDDAIEAAIAAGQV